MGARNSEPDGVRANSSRAHAARSNLFACSALRGGAAPRIEEISPREALLELVKNTYMNLFLTREQRAAEFELFEPAGESCAVQAPYSAPGCNENWKLCELIEKDARTMAGKPAAAAGGSAE